MNDFLKLLFISLIVLALLGLIAVSMGNLILGSSLSARWLENKIKVETGYQVSIEKLQVDLLSGFKLTNIKIALPGSTLPQGGAARLEAEWSWPKLLWGQLHFEKIYIFEPWFKVIQTSLPSDLAASGRTKRRRSKRISSAGNGASSLEVKVDVLEIKDGKLEITGAIPWAASGIDIWGREVLLSSGIQGEFRVQVCSLRRGSSACADDVLFDLNWSPAGFQFTPVSGRVWGGNISGKLSGPLGPGELTGTLAVSGARIERLAAAFKQPEVARGSLDLIMSGLGSGTGSYPPFQVTVSAQNLDSDIFQWLKIPLRFRGGSLEFHSAQAGISQGMIEVDGMVKLTGAQPQRGLEIKAKSVRIRPLLESLLPYLVGPFPRAGLWALAANLSGQKLGNSLLRGSLDLEAKLYPETEGRPESFQGIARIFRGRVGRGSLPPELKSLLGADKKKGYPFNRARTEFYLSGSCLRMKNIRINAGQVLIRGGGTIDLSPEGELDLALVIDLPPKIVSRLGKDIRKLLDPSDRGQGYASISFKLFGHPSRLSTNLLQTTGKKALRDWVKEEQEKDKPRDYWEQRGLELLDKMIK